MNLYFVQTDGPIVTPTLSGTILEGITRDTILTLAGDRGTTWSSGRSRHRRVARGRADGTIDEVFACGTAAVVTPVGVAEWDGGEVSAPDGEAARGRTDIRRRWSTSSTAAPRTGTAG